MDNKDETLNKLSDCKSQSDVYPYQNNTFKSDYEKRFRDLLAFW